MQAGEQMLSRSYHPLLCLVLIGCLFSSNKEEHHTSRDQQAENYKQDNECPIRSRLDGEGIYGTIAAFVRDCYTVFPFLRNRFSEFILYLLFAAIDFDFRCFGRFGKDNAARRLAAVLHAVDFERRCGAVHGHRKGIGLSVHDNLFSLLLFA